MTDHHVWKLAFEDCDSFIKRHDFLLAEAAAVSAIAKRVGAQHHEVRSVLIPARASASRCHSPAGAARALRWPSMADRALFVFPRRLGRIDSAIEEGARRSRSATVYPWTSIRAASAASCVINKLRVVVDMM